MFKSAYLTLGMKIRVRGKARRLGPCGVLDYFSTVLVLYLNFQLSTYYNRVFIEF